jgi:hypothetical protein
LTLENGPRPGSLKLSWLSPGDDGVVYNTVAYSYDMRMGPDTTTAEDFAATDNYVGGLPITYLAGELTEVIVDQLDPQQTYCFSLRTTDTGGNTSNNSNNTPCQSPPADGIVPDFFGIDKATRGDEGGAVNLWWTAAEDHSMYVMDADPANRVIKPILYDIWVRNESDGPLDMNSHAAYRTGYSGTALEIEGLNNNETYEFGVRACDQESIPNCEANDITVKATPTPVSEVPVTVEVYNSEGGLLLVKDGTPNSLGSTTFNDADGVVFYGPTINYSIKYFVDSFALSLDPGNSDQTITAQVGVWDGANFVRGGNTATAFRSKRSGFGITSFKISDTSGVVVNDTEAFAIKLTAGSGATCNAEYGTALTRGDASVAQQIINIPPPNVESPSAILNPGEAVVNISWTPPVREVDGLDNTTEDPLHYDIYGSNNGIGGPWDYVIAEEYVGVPSITWDTQADGITSGSLAVRIKIGDGYGHNELAIATTPVPTADAIDYIPPAKITDLSVTARPKRGAVQLRWTSPGDDYWNNGRASEFEIRYATTDVFTGGGYNSATIFERPPIPDFGYHLAEVEVTDLNPGQEYYFAMKTLDEQLNPSEMSNVAGPVLGGPRCGMCHTTGPSVVESEGNHKLHGKTLNDCTKCHGATAATYGLDHQDGQLTMGYTASGPVVGVINGSTITYYNGAIETAENIMYQDTNGFGGFGNGNFEKQGDGIDDGSCNNFGSLGVGGCHGSAGIDPDGAETKYPQLDTPIWQGAASLECANCHGNPSRTLDQYGNPFDGTIANGDVVPDQIKAAPGTDNRGGWDYNSANVDERMYIGRHEKHLNYSFRFSKNDSCSLCHKGHYEVKADLDGKHGDGKVDIQLDPVAAGVNAHYNTGTAGVVAGGCFDMDPFNCHPSDAEPKWDSTATFDCIGCHTMGGDINKIGHYTDPAGGILGDEVYPVGNELLGNCTWCHFPGHPTDDVGGEAIILPNNPLVGIAYKSGGIHLRRNPGNANHPGAPYATQAELCWGCHDAQTPKISEWGADDSPLNNTATISPNAGDPNYNYGTLSATTRGSWVGTWNGTTGTTALWSSDKFAYKQGNIMSTHTTSVSGVNDVTLVGGEYVETPDTADNIQCHHCHDVHNMNFAAGDTLSGAPFLRGSWVRNPYREDGAPLSSNTYAAYINDYGNVPRGGPGYNESGGYQIDQNNIDATKGLTLGNSAGLCTLCHGTDVDAMNNADDTGDTNDPALWVGTNGHSNAALGGTAVNAADILNYTLAGGRHTISGTVPPEISSNYPDPQNPNMGWVSAGSIDGTTDRRIDGFRSKYNKYGFGVQPLTNVINAYPAFAWGTVQDNGTKQTGFHAFTCSKCHNPHASRLPKLLITNCLDTKQNTWDDTRLIQGTGAGQGVSPNADNNNKTLSNATTAQNCHRLGDASQGGTGGGWNLVTPRLKITPP